MRRVNSCNRTFYMVTALTPGIIYYILSSDKRAIIFGHLLESTPQRNKELFDLFNVLFPDLSDLGFFNKMYSIGQIINAIAGDRKELQLVSVKTEPEFAYGKEVDVMYSALTNHGLIAQPYIQFGLEFAFNWGNCLMATLGYEQGGAPKIEVAQNRIDILKYVAASDVPISVYEVSNAIGISVRDALRHCKYMDNGGALKIASERPNRERTKRLFEYTGKCFSDNSDFTPLELQISKARVKSIITSIRRFARKGDILIIDDIFSLQDCPRSERPRYCLLNFLLQNMFLIKKTQGATTVIRTKRTNQIVKSLIIPIEMALHGNKAKQAEINNLAQKNRRNLLHVVDIGKRFLKHYKHSIRYHI
jgi:hypothetical protein